MTVEVTVVTVHRHRHRHRKMAFLTPTTQFVTVVTVMTVFSPLILVAVPATAGSAVSYDGPQGMATVQTGRREVVRQRRPPGVRRAGRRDDGGPAGDAPGVQSRVVGNPGRRLHRRGGV